MTDAVRLPSESRRCGIQSNSAYLRRPVVAFRKAYEHEGTVMTSPNGRTVRRFTSRDLALVAVFCGIVAALGVVPALHPFGQAVPITAQSMGVMVAGALLGARRAGLALLLFVVLVAAGLPLLAGGAGGIGMFVTPRAGFLVGFPVAAFAVGWMTERIAVPYRLLPGLAATVVGGIAVLYVPGIPWHCPVRKAGLVRSRDGGARLRAR
jgi:biotin transporter BioY